MPNEAQARAFMTENMEENPEFLTGFWFPNPEEYRLIYVDPTVPPTDPAQGLAIFHLVTQEDGVEVGISVGLIRPEEVRQIPPPMRWAQTWEDATEVQAPRRAA